MFVWSIVFYCSTKPTTSKTFVVILKKKIAINYSQFTKIQILLISLKDRLDHSRNMHISSVQFSRTCSVIELWKFSKPTSDFGTILIDPQCAISFSLSATGWLVGLVLDGPSALHAAFHSGISSCFGLLIPWITSI